MSFGTLASLSREGSSSGSAIAYPHPFFDPSSSYIPPSMKEMYRWCRYLALTHSEIAASIWKKAAYIVTELVYDSESQANTSTWKELLEGQLRLRRFELKMLLDYDTFGSSIVSFYIPFERYLICPACKAHSAARRHTTSWNYKDHQFIGSCPQCRKSVKFTVRDQKIQKRSNIKLIRWNPMQVDISYNPLTDTSTYYYNLPNVLKRRITDYENGKNKELVIETPLSFLKAAKDNSLVRLKNVFHMKRPSISTDDDAYPAPPLLSVFKDVWLYQVYRRAQEAIALEHVLPMTVLTPAVNSGGDSPHSFIDIGEWTDKMQTIVRRWRRDQNGIFTMPYPAQKLDIRGDAQALNVHNDMTQLRQQITGGLDLPQEFLYGGMNYSGSSISLRVLENSMLVAIESLNRDFLQEYVVPNLARLCNLPPINVKHRDFKMADDPQQKQIALSLRATNTISDETTIAELGFDYALEQTRRAAEEKARADQLARQTIGQAHIQGQQMLINAVYEALAQGAASRAMAEQNLGSPTLSGTPNDPAIAGAPRTPSEVGLPGGESNSSSAGTVKPSGAPNSPSDGSSARSTGSLISPEHLANMAHDILKSHPPSQIDQVVAVLSQSNPQLAKAVKSRQKLINSQGKSIGDAALPEQKPPRRKDSPI